MTNVKRRRNCAGAAVRNYLAELPRSRSSGDHTTVFTQQAATEKMPQVAHTPSSSNGDSHLKSGGNSGPEHWARDSFGQRQWIKACAARTSGLTAQEPETSPSTTSRQILKYTRLQAQLECGSPLRLQQCGSAFSASSLPVHLPQLQRGGAFQLEKKTPSFNLRKSTDLKTFEMPATEANGTAKGEKKTQAAIGPCSGSFLQAMAYCSATQGRTTMRIDADHVEAKQKDDRLVMAKGLFPEVCAADREGKGVAGDECKEISSVELSVEMVQFGGGETDEQDHEQGEAVDRSGGERRKEKKGYGIVDVCQHVCGICSKTFQNERGLKIHKTRCCPNIPLQTRCCPVMVLQTIFRIDLSTGIEFFFMEKHAKILYCVLCRWCKGGMIVEQDHNDGGIASVEMRLTERQQLKLLGVNVDVVSSYKWKNKEKQAHQEFEIARKKQQTEPKKSNTVEQVKLDDLDKAEGLLKLVKKTILERKLHVFQQTYAGMSSFMVCASLDLCADMLNTICCVADLEQALEAKHSAATAMCVSQNDLQHTVEMHQTELENLGKHHQQEAEQLRAKWKTELKVWYETVSTLRDHLNQTIPNALWLSDLLRQIHRAQRSHDTALELEKFLTNWCADPSQALLPGTLKKEASALLSPLPSAVNFQAKEVDEGGEKGGREASQNFKLQDASKKKGKENDGQEKADTHGGGNGGITENSGAEEKQMTRRLSYLKRSFIKFFPGHGEFKGCVQEYFATKDTYLVVYEDDDEEEMFYKEMKTLVRKTASKVTVLCRDRDQGKGKEQRCILPHLSSVRTPGDCDRLVLTKVKDVSKRAGLEMLKLRSMVSDLDIALSLNNSFIDAHGIVDTIGKYGTREKSVEEGRLEQQKPNEGWKIKGTGTEKAKDKMTQGC